MDNLAVSMQGITKIFNGVKANDNVDFNLRKGSIHGLLGENGAGKTTLMNILYGLYQQEAGDIYINGSKEEIYDHPSHPYTIGLFGAIPNLESDVRRLANIEGLPPDPSNLPTGCSFAPRCPYATEECRTKPPKSEQIAEKHYCSCYIGRQKRGAV